MSRFDQDREDLIQLIISICDYARLGYEVSTYNNCNSCNEKINWWKRQKGLFPEVLELKLVK